MDELLFSFSKEKFQEITQVSIEKFNRCLDENFSPLIKNHRGNISIKNELKDKLISLWQVLCEGDYLGLNNSKILIATSTDYLHKALFSQEYNVYGAESRLLLRELLYNFLGVVVRENAFESNIASARELLANLHEFDEDWLEAAKALSVIPLDTGHRLVSNQEKARIYIRIMRLLLEAEDPVSASAYVNRTAAVIDPNGDPQENIMFKSCQARILDSNRSFQKAAWKYFELSCIPLVAEDDRLTSLAQSMKCIALAEAGPQRSRFLATIYKDDRSQKVEPKVLFIIIEYMYLDRMISAELKREFASQLAPHQLALLSDGSTLLDKAVVEHNIVCCSCFYSNIYIDQLASILDISLSKVELTVGKLIAEGNLSASIDQIEGLISFHGSGAKDIPKGAEDDSLSLSNESDPTSMLSKEWDEHIFTVGTHLEDIFYLLRTRHPEWILSHTSG